MLLLPLVIVYGTYFYMLLARVHKFKTLHYMFYPAKIHDCNHN
jgi:hypothetical protein